MDKKFLLRSLSTNIITFTTLAIYLLVFSPNLSTNIRNYSRQENYYQGINTDFIITGPRSDQISLLNSDSNVNQVTPFYELNLYFNNKTDFPNSTVRSIPNLSEQTGHLFSKEKVLSKLDTELAPNSILIDSIIAQRYGVVVGSTLNLSFNDYSFNFIVHSIYSSIPMFQNGIAYFLFSSNFENALKTIISKLYFTGAYIDVKDKIAFVNYLKDDYLPLGRLGFRQDYNDESIYEIIYENIISNYQYNVSNVFIFQLIDESNLVQIDLINDVQIQSMLNSFIYGFIFILNFFLILPFLNKLRRSFSFASKQQVKHVAIISSLLFILGTFSITSFNILSHSVSQISLVFTYFMISSFISVGIYTALIVFTINQFKNVKIHSNNE